MFQTVMKMILCNVFVFFAFFSLLTAPIVKHSHIYARIYFILQKLSSNKLESLLITNFDLSEKIRKVVTK